MGSPQMETTQHLTKKRHKVHLARPTIVRKVVAFHEIINLDRNRKSEREVADLLEVPNSTMQFWRKQERSQDVPTGLVEFFSTPVGADFLQRNTMAVMKLMKCGPGGIQGMQEYLRLSRLDRFVASSEGALQNFWVRCEVYILGFSRAEESRLSKGMKHKKITVVLDEMFRGKRPCLVAIEAISNYIILEKFTEDRTADTWQKELGPRLDELNVELGQVVSDLCGAIRSVEKLAGAEHSTDLFHGQYEISKATSGALSSQERAAERAFKESEEAVKKNACKPRRIGIEDKVQQQSEQDRLEHKRDHCKEEYEIRKKRREMAQEARKELGKIYHPIDLNTGKIQSPTAIKKKIAQQFDVIKSTAKEAKLAESSTERIDKAERAFACMGKYIRSFFLFLLALIVQMKLTIKERKFFKEVVFPLCYFNMIWKRLSKKEKERLRHVFQDLQKKFQETQESKEVKEEMMRRGKEAAERFQRSSSCVEGRNGILSLNYHRFRRLNARSLQVLSIVYNFTVRRSDGTTAAERFFEAKHGDLFESLVKNVRIPNKPQQQNHDPKKRLEGWEKRRTA